MIKTILQTVLVLGLFTSNLSAEEKLIPGGDSARESTCSSTEYFDGNGSYFDDTNIHMASGLAATTVVNVDTPTLMITGLFSHNRNSERGIELYVLEDIPDLSIYAIGVVNTAAGSEGPEFYLSGAATAGQFLYLALYPETFQDFLGFAPDFDLGGSSNLGAFGTQAVELFVDDSGIPTLIDVYGIATESGSAQSWDYRSAWAYRKNNTGPDTTVNLNNWRIPGPFICEGYSNPLDAPIPFPHGTDGPAYDES
nr:hypothetical protein [Saprospiraceae bacterium]